MILKDDNNNKRKQDYDCFGVLQLYKPTEHSPEPFVMSNCNPNRLVLIGQTGDCEGTTAAAVTRTEIGLGPAMISVCSIDANSFYHEAVECNHTNLERRGYMQTVNDWRNVEMTQYVNITSFAGSPAIGGPHLSMMVRGGAHGHSGSGGNRSSSSMCGGCQGTALKAGYYSSGMVKFEKELHHTRGYSKVSDDPVSVDSSRAFKGFGWIGIKFVVYNLANGFVKLELWMDIPAFTTILDPNMDNEVAPANNWTKVLEHTDTGSNWCTQNNITHCGSTNPCQKISWGGPLATFRSDNLVYNQKWVSVREINYRL